MTRDEQIVKIAKFNTIDVEGVTLLDEKIIEEFGEFLQALKKYDKKDKGFITELADVTIVLNELYATLGDKEKKALDKEIQFKLNRTIKRLKLDKE